MRSRPGSTNTLRIGRLLNASERAVLVEAARLLTQGGCMPIWRRSLRQRDSGFRDKYGVELTRGLQLTVTNRAGRVVAQAPVGLCIELLRLAGDAPLPVDPRSN